MTKPSPASLPIPPAVHASGIGKRFPGVVALDDVSLDFAPGAVTAVLGENGAGKSTLMSILAGLQAPGSGELEIHGERVAAFTPTNLLTTHGVALVPQEVALARERTVAANVLMGIEPGLFPSRAAMTQRTRALLEDVGAEHISPTAEVRHLGLADRQLLLIARAVGRRCRILILDEPTTSLTPQEVERLFGLLRRLRDAGTTLLYVSHRLPEIFALSEAIHVLRDGRHVASFRTDEVDAQSVIRAMVGRDLAARENEPRTRSGEPRVVISGLSGKGFREISLELGRGEIVGLAGLPDCGRSELVSALFGDRASTGGLTIDAAPVSLRNPRAAIRAGIGFVPVERRSQAIFPDLDVAANLAVLDLADVGRFGLLSRESIKRIGRDRIGQFDIRGGANARITQLSGGNQQKIILARWLSRRPRLLLLDDPTRGVDVGAKLEIHRLLGVAASAGTSILLSSSDLPELLFVCDRIVVLAHGRIVGDLTAGEASERRIMALAAGVERELAHVD